jgi:manganese/zinc/iron transport system permease protein
MATFFTLDFIPFLAALLASLSCALLGNFLVLRRLSLMGDAISHTVLPGIVLSFLIFDTRGGPLLIVGALISAIATTVLVETTKKLANLETGAAMGVVFSSLFALGVLLMEQAAARKVDLDADCLLYGQIEGLLWFPPPDTSFIQSLYYIPVEIYTLSVVFALSLFFVFAFYKELRLASFDPEMSTSLGFNATGLHYLQMIVTAAAVVAAFEAVGSILVIGMLICPAASARLLTDKLLHQLTFSLVIASASTLLGYLGATQVPSLMGFDVTLSVSGMMLVAAGFIFIIILITAPKYGVCAQWYRRKKLSLTITLEDILGTVFRFKESNASSVSDSAVVLQEPFQQLVKQRLPHPCTEAYFQKALQYGQRCSFFTSVTPAIHLSPEGHKRALALIRSHRLWENYLLENTDLEAHEVHTPAEALEHYTSSVLLNKLAANQENNKKDPHGKEIPEEK